MQSNKRHHYVQELQTRAQKFLFGRSLHSTIGGHERKEARDAWNWVTECRVFFASRTGPLVLDKEGSGQCLDEGRK